MLCHVLCYVMLCYVMLCYVMLCYVMLCCVVFCFQFGDVPITSAAQRGKFRKLRKRNIPR